MTRRMVSLLLALAMVAGMLPMPARAAEECVCQTQCVGEKVDRECPVCGPEGADLTKCAHYKAPETEPAKPETTAPAETQAQETTAAAETQAAETEAAETQAAETQAAETEAGETQAQETTAEATAEAVPAALGETETAEETSAAVEETTESTAESTAAVEETAESETEAADQVEESTEAAETVTLCAHGREGECAICAVEAMIAALPEAETLAEMDDEGYDAAYAQFDETTEAFIALDEEDQLLVANADKLMAVFEKFSEGRETYAETRVFLVAEDSYPRVGTEFTIIADCDTSVVDIASLVWEHSTDNTNFEELTYGTKIGTSVDLIETVSGTHHYRVRCALKDGSGTIYSDSLAIYVQAPSVYFDVDLPLSISLVPDESRTLTVGVKASDGIQVTLNWYKADSFGTADKTNSLGTGQSLTVGCPEAGTEDRYICVATYTENNGDFELSSQVVTVRRCEATVTVNGETTSYESVPIALMEVRKNPGCTLTLLDTLGSLTLDASCTLNGGDLANNVTIESGASVTAGSRLNAVTAAGELILPAGASVASLTRSGGTVTIPEGYKLKDSADNWYDAGFSGMISNVTVSKFPPVEITGTSNPYRALSIVQGFTCRVTAEPTNGTTYQWYLQEPGEAEPRMLVSETAAKLKSMYAAKIPGDFVFYCDVTNSGYTVRSGPMTVHVNAVDLADAKTTVTLDTAEMTVDYTGAAINPGVKEIKVQVSPALLTAPATGYTVEYKNAEGEKVEEIKDVGTYKVIVKAVPGGAYVNQKEFYFEVKSIEITDVTWKNVYREYGDDKAVEAYATIGGQKVKLVVDDRNPGGNAGEFTATASLPEEYAKNCTLAEGVETQEYTIGKARIGVILDSAEKVYDGTTDAQYGDVGSYAITAKGLTAKNYEITYQPGTLTVGPRTVELSWSVLSGSELVYDGNGKVLTVSVANAVHDDAVTGTLALVGDNVNVTEAGFQYRVTALSSGNYVLPQDVLSPVYHVAPKAVAILVSVSGVPAVGKTLTAEVGLSDEKATVEYQWFRDGGAVSGETGKTYVLTEADFGKVISMKVSAVGNYSGSGESKATSAVTFDHTVTLPENQVGYRLTADKAIVAHKGSVKLTFVLMPGYSKTEAFAVKVNGEAVTLAEDGTYVISGITEDQVVTVEGVADVTAPTARIQIAKDGWSSFLNTITFERFFKETQKVTITAADLGSGVASVQYFVAKTAKTLAQVQAYDGWTTYGKPFHLDPDGQYVVYAKVTDNGGNVLYISSDGLILDATAPAISGVENGKTYYGDVSFQAKDAYLESVAVDGKAVTDCVIAADNKEHIITATDKAGNVTVYKVTVMKVYTVTYKADGEVVEEQKVGHGQDAVPPKVPHKSGYFGRWNKSGKNITADTVITAKYTRRVSDWWENPKTGDSIGYIFGTLAISFAALCGLSGYVIWQKKRKK